VSFFPSEVALGESMQNPDQFDGAERAEAGEFNPTIPHMSPDGSWVLYTV
jgi:hypothetical protein